MAKPKKFKVRGTLDGGVSWLVVLSSFLQQLVIMGVHNVFGLLYIDLLAEFKQSKAATAWIASLSFSLTFMLGPLTTSLCTKYGVRSVAVLGAILFALGLFCSSFAGSLFKMYVTYSLLVATGSSFCYYVSILVLDEYFSKRLVAANGIALSGAGIGTIALTPLVSFLLQRYEWRNTMRVLSGISLVILLVCALMLFAVPAPIKIIDSPRFNPQKKTFDLGVFKNKAFVVWVLVQSLVLFGFYIPYVHLVRHGQDLDIHKSAGGILVGYMAISQTIGKIFFGRIADHPRVNRIYLDQFCLLMCSVMTTLLTIFSSYTSLAMYCWIFGFFDGGFVVMIAVLTGDIVGRGNLASAFGIMYMISALPMMIGPPVAGWMYEITQTYVPAFFMAGAMTITGVCLLFLIPILLPQRVREEWALRNGAFEIVPGSSTPSSSTTKASWSIAETKISELSVDVGSEKTESPMTKSGARRVVYQKKKAGNTAGMEYILERYFSMPQVVTQRECLLSRVYSKENVYLNDPNRETNV